MKKTKIRAAYSGPGSKKFWAAVKALPDEEHEALYASGVLLQEMEERVLAWLSDAHDQQASRKRIRK